MGLIQTTEQRKQSNKDLQASLKVVLKKSTKRWKALNSVLPTYYAQLYACIDKNTRNVRPQDMHKFRLIKSAKESAEWELTTLNDIITEINKVVCATNVSTAYAEIESSKVNSQIQTLFKDLDNMLNQRITKLTTGKSVAAKSAQASAKTKQAQDAADLANSVASDMHGSEEEAAETLSSVDSNFIESILNSQRFEAPSGMESSPAESKGIEFDIDSMFPLIPDHKPEDSEEDEETKKEDEDASGDDDATANVTLTQETKKPEPKRVVVRRQPKPVINQLVEASKSTVTPFKVRRRRVHKSTNVVE